MNKVNKKILKDSSKKLKRLEALVRLTGSAKKSISPIRLTTSQMRRNATTKKRTLPHVFPVYKYALSLTHDHGRYT